MITESIGNTILGCPWLTVVGLGFDIIGTVFLVYGLIISKRKAVELGVSRYSDTYEGNLKLPAVIDRLKQSRNAMIGLLFLVSGFLLQIIGQWPH